MKEGDGFIVANLLKTKLAGDPILQEPQSRPLKPVKKVWKR